MPARVFVGLRNFPVQRNFRKDIPWIGRAALLLQQPMIFRIAATTSAGSIRTV